MNIKTFCDITRWRKSAMSLAIIATSRMRELMPGLITQQTPCVAQSTTDEYEKSSYSSRNKRKCMNIPFHRSTALDAHTWYINCDCLALCSLLAMGSRWATFTCLWTHDESKGFKWKETKSWSECISVCMKLFGEMIEKQTAWWEKRGE
jgi:hypothetical protein